MAFAESLRAWHDLFLLAGGGAATLLGLVFVAVSLATSLPELPEREQRDLFVSPILTQFGYAFALAATSLAPWQQQRSYGLFVAVIGLSAGAQCVRLLFGLLRHHRVKERIDLIYWFWASVMPLATSLTIVGSGISVWRTQHNLIPGVAVATLLLDLMGVRNTWQLVTWILVGRSRARD